MCVHFSCTFHLIHIYYMSAYALIWNRKGTPWHRHWKNNAYIKGAPKYKTDIFLSVRFDLTTQAPWIRRVDFLCWSLFFLTYPTWLLFTYTWCGYVFDCFSMLFSFVCSFISFWFWLFDWLCVWLIERKWNKSLGNLCMHSIDMCISISIVKCYRFVIGMRWKSDLIFL